LNGLSLRRRWGHISQILILLLFGSLFLHQKPIFESRQHGEDLLRTHPSKDKEPNDTSNNDSNVGCVVKVGVCIDDKDIFGDLLFGVEKPVMFQLALDGLNVNLSVNAQEEVLKVWVLFGEFGFLC
jgi:hypothetical protein